MPMNISHFDCSSRRPIAFCLDLSKTMGIQNSLGIAPIDVLNDVARKCIAVLSRYYEYCLEAEVAYISTATKNCSKVSFTRYPFKFSDCGVETNSNGQLADAIFESMRAIDVRRTQLRTEGISCNTPMLIVFTDKKIVHNDRISQLLDKYCDPSLSAETRMFGLFFHIGSASDAIAAKKYYRNNYTIHIETSRYDEDLLFVLEGVYHLLQAFDDAEKRGVRRDFPPISRKVPVRTFSAEEMNELLRDLADNQFCRE